MKMNETELRRKLDLVIEKLLNLGGPENEKELEETGGEAILPLAPFYTKLNDILDRKLSAIQQVQNVYVENHTYIDGDEVSSRTVTKVDAKMVKNRRKGR